MAGEAGAVSLRHANPPKENHMLAAILIAPILGALTAVAAVWLMARAPERRSEPLGRVRDVPAGGAGDREADAGKHHRNHDVAHQS